jgi:hypothetical protein
MAPFYSPAPNIDAPGIGGVSDSTFTGILVGATAVAIGAHLVGTIATGRLHGGGPMDAPPPTESPAAAPPADTSADEGGE